MAEFHFVEDNEDHVDISVLDGCALGQSMCMALK